MLYRESETVELKQDYSESVRKDIIAFANTNGGTIFLGINDAGEVVGIPSPDQLIQRVSNMVRDSIRPDVTMFSHYETVETDGTAIVKITVSQGAGRPYYWEEKGLRPAGVYVRQGTSSAPATDVAIRRMIRETDGDSYEEMRSLRQNLTFSYAVSVFEKRNLELKNPQMVTLGLVSADGVYTNLGLLLSDQCPHIIKAAVFSGTDQSFFQDRREFGGSLLQQLEDAYAFLEMRNETAATFEGLHRIDHRAYPEGALREALLNTVVHRDYSVSASTLISCYSDRIEMVSAGGLVQGYTLADVLMGFSVCRNPRLANIFFRLNLIEAYGTGLKKILSAYPSCPAGSLLQETPKVFKVTLPRLSPSGLKEPAHPYSDADQVLSLFAESETISRADAERVTGLSTASAIRLLRKMTENGDLIVTGKGKRTRYLRP